MRLRSTYNLPYRFLLAVGNFKPHKNIERFLEAHAPFAKEYPLVCVGKEGKTSAHLHFIPHISDEDLPILYSMASMLVFPSLYEGFGLPPLEAMACGTPALVSTAGSLPEVCQEGAYYVDPLSIESMQKGIEELLFCQKTRLNLIERGFSVAKRYSWETTAARYASLFYELSLS